MRCRSMSRSRLAAAPGPGLRALRPRARGRRADERRAARRRDARRGRHARQQRRHDGLLTSSTEATAESFRGGWFHSGDIGGRGTPTATSSSATGRRTSSSPAARTSRRSRSSSAVARHPAVLECAVVAVPDEKWGERSRRRSSRSSQAARRPTPEIIDFCRQHIAHFKRPAAVEFGDLPKTSTGQGPEVRPAREGVEGPGEADQLDAPAWQHSIVHRCAVGPGRRDPRDTRARRDLRPPRVLPLLAGRTPRDAGAGGLEPRGR